MTLETLLRQAVEKAGATPQTAERSVQYLARAVLDFERLHKNPTQTARTTKAGTLKLLERLRHTLEAMREGEPGFEAGVFLTYTRSCKRLGLTLEDLIGVAREAETAAMNKEVPKGAPEASHWIGFDQLIREFLLTETKRFGLRWTCYFDKTKGGGAGSMFNILSQLRDEGFIPPNSLPDSDVTFCKRVSAIRRTHRKSLEVAG